MTREEKREYRHNYYIANRSIEIERSAKYNRQHRQQIIERQHKRRENRKGTYTPLYNWRIEHRFLQAEVGRLVGLTQGQISNIETGVCSVPQKIQELIGIVYAGQI